MTCASSFCARPHPVWAWLDVTARKAFSLAPIRLVDRPARHLRVSRALTTAARAAWAPQQDGTAAEGSSDLPY